jgi:hypothetical protein
MRRHNKRPASHSAADLRPIAKRIVKRALRAYDVAKEALAEAGEHFESLVKEARAEMKDAKPARPSKKKNR